MEIWACNRCDVSCFENNRKIIYLTSFFLIECRYNAGGISIDWAHKDVGIDLVYALEMRDSGLYGFLLPPDQIEPSAKETWYGINAVLLAYAEDLNNNVTIATTTEESSA